MDAPNKSGHDETAQLRSFPRKRESSIHRDLELRYLVTPGLVPGVQSGVGRATGLSYV